MIFGSLFSGIGLGDLGAERAGWACAFQVEIDPWCSKVLAYHWPEVPRFADVRALDSSTLPKVDALIGGFPCQDISVAGRKAGIHGEKSGLWFEYHRLIRECQPRVVIIENVGRLRSAGLGDVLRSLADIWYDAEWDVLSAADLGAPHIRPRCWIVAYPHGERLPHADRLQLRRLWERTRTPRAATPEPRLDGATRSVDSACRTVGAWSPASDPVASSRVRSASSEEGAG